MIVDLQKCNTSSSMLSVYLSQLQGVVNLIASTLLQYVNDHDIIQGISKWENRCKGMYEATGINTIIPLENITTQVISAKGTVNNESVLVIIPLCNT